MSAREGRHNRDGGGPHYGQPLGRRQREVVELATNGVTNKAIARRLGISEQTVKHHLTVVYIKLGVTNRLTAGLHLYRQALAEQERREDPHD